MSLKRWSYFLEMVSLVENHRSCLGVQGVLEAGAGEERDGVVQVVHALEHAGPVEVVDGLADLGAVLAGEDQLRLARGRALVSGLVDVAVGVTGDGDGLLPGCTTRVMPLTMMGARNTVPSRMARMVPLGTSTSA